MADEQHPFFEAAGVGVDADLFPIGEEVKSRRFDSVGRGHPAWRFFIGKRQWNWSSTAPSVPRIRIRFWEVNRSNDGAGGFVVKRVGLV